MYQRSTLENGLLVVTEKVPNARTTSIGVLVAASPRHEAPGKSGLAHLTEHCLFDGTSSRDTLAIARLLDSGGGRCSAFTTRDYTAFTATVLDSYQTFALELFGDILQNSIFPLEGVERQKAVIRCEIASAMDSPGTRADELLKEAVWRGEPIARSVRGIDAEIEALAREDVIYFNTRHYGAKRTVVASTGCVEHRDFVAQTRDSFWRMETASEDAPAVAPKFRPSLSLEARPVSQAYFCFSLPAHPYRHPDRFGLHVLCAYLGGGVGLAFVPVASRKTGPRSLDPRTIPGVSRRGADVPDFFGPVVARRRQAPDC